MIHNFLRLYFVGLTLLEVIINDASVIFKNLLTQHKSNLMVFRLSKRYNLHRISDVSDQDIKNLVVAFASSDINLCFFSSKP